MKNLTRTLSDLGIGFLFLFALIGLGLLFVLLFRPLYLFDLQTLHLAETTGYSREEILENYGYLIRTCLPFFSGTFHLPTLPSSASGIQHFAEVRQIFRGIYILSTLSVLLLLPIVYLKNRKHDYRFLKTSGLLVLLLPIVLIFLCAVSFHTVFMLMHKLLFRNDLWLFDPVTDPIIELLPEEYFLHCAAVLFLFLIAGGILLLLCYRHLKRKSAA